LLAVIVSYNVSESRGQAVLPHRVLVAANPAAIDNHLLVTLLSSIV